MSLEPFLTKLTLRNFRSIRNEVIEFTNPLVLVGRNGSGKSNFVDALTFLSSCVNSPLDSAIDQQRNIWSQFQLANPYPPPIGLRAEFTVPGVSAPCGHYAFSFHIASNELEVLREQCVLTNADGSRTWFDRDVHSFRSNLPGINPVIASQSLALPAVAGAEKLAPLKALAALRAYRVRPDAVRSSQEAGNTGFLLADASNIVGKLGALRIQNRHTLSRILELLIPIAPALTEIDIVPLVKPPYGTSRKLSLQLKQTVNAQATQKFFSASEMSDGTLAMLALIVAALQSPTPAMMAIEEPEAFVHPGALDAVADVMQIAAQRSQVVITTHSPELLEAKWLQPENLRVVEWESGETHISKLGEAPVQALQQHLMGAGELLRANALDAAPRHPEDPSELFDETPA